MVHIAKIRSEFPAKFGIPRQSGLIEGLRSTIVFEPEFRNPDALRGLEGFSHIWLLWEFSGNLPCASGNSPAWSPTVRPPRLGGNTRMGVFATRSPFRPNPIGLSCVRIESIETDAKDGPLIHVSGADLMDGTPIYDIKPYIPVTDCHPEASEGFTAQTKAIPGLEVIIPAEAAASYPADKLEVLRQILAQDPRPHYQDDPDRTYGFQFSGYEIHFNVNGITLTVTDILPALQN